MLAVDMVEKANSGHPGLPLGAAPMAYVLWTRFMRHNPSNPKWFNRDRFILSAGHGSAMLYALLHLCGYDLPMEEIENFRQWESKTPGHPEYGMTPGVEATTGPLGQGFGMGAGMALAETYLADCFNRPDNDIINHYTYAIVSDGDLMEGVASEAASLAATIGLGKLIYLYDDNGISIEGPTDIAFTEDVSRRFQAYGWQVIRVADGNDLESIAKAITNAQSETEKPSLIMVKTKIGYGSPKEDSPSAHGEPLGADAIKAVREKFGWPNESFFVPGEVRDRFAAVIENGKKLDAEWNEKLGAYTKANPEKGEALVRQINGELPPGWEKSITVFGDDDGPMATRAASGKVLNSIAAAVPNIIGGSADLAPSNKTLLTGYNDMGAGRPNARNIRFGVREHAMGAMVNGMALHGGIIPYGGTFFVFSDYMRPSIRLAALMGVKSIFVFTHDSIGVGEDGPTHQPIEHLASLRAMPGLTIIRPADANETAGAWKYAMESSKPTALILTRQKLPVLTGDGIVDQVAKGAYILSDAEGEPDVILIATGSEVSLAVNAKEILSTEGVKVRIVSMPSWELFAAQPQEYKDDVLPVKVEARLAVEAGVCMGWARWVGAKGGVIALDDFGASAPGGRIFKERGFTPENVAARAKALIKA